ncbi:HEAT repeat domain-containing protein [Streptomyces sp. NPDC051664]|jgi:hypothetical protein|uniref:HEAT repeat domain-containing protein n=1 Tax=Streptomyces sp. NPDC051664 TaxID=3365668 RepID=UPI00378D9D9B
MDARAELIHIGSPAIPAIVDGLPSLGSFGRLTAVEVFEEVGDPRCGPALTELLADENNTVREWAALTLSALGISDAVEPLACVPRACVVRATPPDDGEPVGIRSALAALGAQDRDCPQLRVCPGATRMA